MCNFVMQNKWIELFLFLVNSSCNLCHLFVVLIHGYIVAAAIRVSGFTVHVHVFVRFCCHHLSTADKTSLVSVMNAVSGGFVWFNRFCWCRFDSITVYTVSMHPEGAVAVTG